MLFFDLVRLTVPKSAGFKFWQIRQQEMQLYIEKQWLFTFSSSLTNKVNCVEDFHKSRPTHSCFGQNLYFTYPLSITYDH